MPNVHFKWLNGNSVTFIQIHWEHSSSVVYFLISSIMLENLSELIIHFTDKLSYIRRCVHLYYTIQVYRSECTHWTWDVYCFDICEHNMTTPSVSVSVPINTIWSITSHGTTGVGTKLVGNIVHFGIWKNFCIG